MTRFSLEIKFFGLIGFENRFFFKLNYCLVLDHPIEILVVPTSFAIQCDVHFIIVAMAKLVKKNILTLLKKNSTITLFFIYFVYTLLLLLGVFKNRPT